MAMDRFGFEYVCSTYYPNIRTPTFVLKNITSFLGRWVTWEVFQAQVALATITNLLQNIP